LPASSKASRIVLNLMILNGFAWRPGRFYKKKTEPLLTIAKRIKTPKIIGDSKINRNNADKKSTRGLSIFL
jgi:hypothetical protein